MSKQTYYYVVAAVFTMVGALHLIRGISGWEMTIGGIVIPLWTSWAAAILLGYLAVTGLRFGSKM